MDSDELSQIMREGIRENLLAIARRHYPDRDINTLEEVQRALLDAELAGIKARIGLV